MKRWWISEITGELQKNLFDVMVVTVQNVFRYHFLDLTWHRWEAKNGQGKQKAE